MIKNMVDPHVHSLMGHARSTIWENVQIAAKFGLEAIAITNHFGLYLPWFCENRNLNIEEHTVPGNVPPIIEGVRVFSGAEIDIVDLQGNLAGHDFTLSGYRGYATAAELVLSKEVIIAGVHYFDGMREGNEAQYTQMYCNALATPGVNILAHSPRYGFPFDFNEVSKAAKAFGKMIEFNNSTIKQSQEQWDVHIRLAEACANNGAMISIGSDAHFCTNVGEVSMAAKLLAEVGFPEELIATRSLEAFEAML